MRQVDQLGQVNIEDLKIKIEQVKHDVKKLGAEPGNDRQMSVLKEYQSYLEDELTNLEKGQK